MSLLPQPSAIFMTLKPANLESQHLFDELSQAIIANTQDRKIKTPELEHAAKFMFIERFAGLQFSGQEIPIEQREIATELDTEVDDASTVSEKMPLYQGHYNFAFRDADPLVPRQGWVVGFGRFNHKKRGSTSSSDRPDVLLALPGTSGKKYEVAGKHARIFFDQEGTLTLKVFSQRGFPTVIGNTDIGKGQRSITERESRVSFGSLSYILEFAKEMTEETFQAGLREYTKQNGIFEQNQSLWPDFSATPSPMDHLVGDWNIRSTVGKGTFGTVNATKNVRTGICAAAKKLIRKSNDDVLKIGREINTLRILPSNPRLLKFLEVIYERGDKWYSAPEDEEDFRHLLNARPENVILISTPFARFDLSQPLFIAQHPAIHLATFYQILQGVAALHDAGFIHRDIKPANIGVVKQTADYIEIVILDYGETVHQSTCDSKPGTVGTIPYLAPEMEAMIYGKEVDIWACGVVGLMLFWSMGKNSWFRVVNEQVKWQEVLTKLKSSGFPSTSVQMLLVQMLEWDPTNRITAVNALVHPCFATLKINSYFK